ncbi:aminodeoxychorismate lyase [Salinicola halophilus]|uniref:aminodeoxychorismate lyase n=1 Tax=Salinicola halophilus TaxID=184065 RepID=UPI000DA183BE|nr:aminodeoxychorismate lyase [Salinicola halophilus]
MRDVPLALNDRGLAYGDGLFETVLVRDGHPRLWAEHLARLTDGCRRLGMTPPAREGLESIFADCGSGLAVVKIVVTRGEGGRGYRPPEHAEMQWRWSVAPFSPARERLSTGICVRLCQLQLGIQPALAGLKHMARLENVMARREWRDESIAEGLLCDSDGYLVEATAMNLLWRRGGVLETPALDRCGVAGTLLAALDAHLPIRRVRLVPDELARAEAVWVLNSVQGVWPIHTLLDADAGRLAQWEVPPEDDVRRLATALLDPVVEEGDRPFMPPNV